MLREVTGLMNRNLRQPSDLCCSVVHFVPFNISILVLHMEILMCMMIILATRYVMNYAVFQVFKSCGHKRKHNLTNKMTELQLDVS